jgi:hypothetical protein
MAEEKVVASEVTWRQLLPWTALFRGFQVTLDVKKLFLAALGILVMAFGWWLLSLIFTATERPKPPQWPGNYISAAGEEGKGKAWTDFHAARQHWNLIHEATGLDRSEAPPAYEVADLADTLAEYHYFDPTDTGENLTRQQVREKIAELEKKGTITPEDAARLRAKYTLIGQVKPFGRLSISPWSEDRGPNPYLLVTGQAGIPWQAGAFWEWFTRDQVPVMIEPLIKFVRPIVYFLSPRNDFWSRVYFLLVTLWTLLTWSLFGGAITRIAVVELARNESVGLFEALRFTGKRFLSYITAPLFPLAFVFVMLVLLALFGLLYMIPGFGDILIAGVFWPLALLAGLGMAVALVFLVSWPLMAVTVSAEGSDSWEAVSRAYGYVINRPWQCVWYSVVAIVYGGVIVFFIGFMASLGVYLAKWGVSQTPLIQTTGRDPSFLFIYAPTSFGWRELLLEGTKVEPPKDAKPDVEKFKGADVVASRALRTNEGAGVGGFNRHNRIDPGAYRAYVSTLTWYNIGGAAFVAFWLYLLFLGVLGFGYAYFWSASTIIYLLLRRSMDAAEMDEVYFEEDDYDSFRMPTPAGGPAAPAAPAPVAPAAGRPLQTLPVVEAPRPIPAPAPVVPAAPTASVVPEPRPSPAPVPVPAVEPRPVYPTPAEKPVEPAAAAPLFPDRTKVENPGNGEPPAD